jgi:hypothetical protein
MKAAWTPTQWGRARVTLRWVTHNAEVRGEPQGESRST